MQTLKAGFNALVVESIGGFGSAIADEFSETSRCGDAVRLSRRNEVSLNLSNDDPVSAAAAELRVVGKAFDLIFEATGVLTIGLAGPEKSLSTLPAETMTRSFAINVIWPALLLRYFAPLLSVDGKGVFATFSARVGSIADNQLGGWNPYHTSKAALYRFVKTAAIEITRKRPAAICLSLHPGTVRTVLSQRDAHGKFSHSIREAAQKLLPTIELTRPEQTGSLLAFDGTTIPW